VVVDGVINPKAWVGSAATAGQIQDDRLHSADGAWKALAEILRRCAAAGPDNCAFSSSPLRRFGELAARLQRQPITVGTLKVTYASFIGMVLSALYQPDAGAEVTGLAVELYELVTAGSAASPNTLSEASDRIGRLLQRGQGRAFPYDNSFDAYAAVMCTDGRHPASAASWPKAVARADKRATYFGRAWGWASVQCARGSWTVHDEDAYTGPFTKHTRYPVLFVGSFWDPATNYADAVASSKLLPNSRLLSSDNWGHTAYGTSACATGATDRYLLYRSLPAVGTTCVGDNQPFRTPPTSSTAQAAGAFDFATATAPQIAAQGLPAPGSPKVLPPVV